MNDATDTPSLEVLPPPQQRAPVISVSEDEVVEIMEAMGLMGIRENGSALSSETPTKKECGIDVRKALRLGLFVEGNSVALENAKVLVADQVLMSHLVRLNEAAGKLTNPKELKEIAYPMGYVAGQLKKSPKTRIVLEAASNAPQRPVIPSWAPGEKVLPPAASA